jgi:hypothetical protein
MATMIVAGQELYIDPSEVETTKSNIRELKPGQALELQYFDGDGDEHWAYVPWGTPVVIVGY